MNHTKMSLGGNVLKCDCHAKWLLSWMLSYRHNILDIDDILFDSGEQLIKKPQDAFICVLSMAEVTLVVVSTVVTVSVVLISLAPTHRQCVATLQSLTTASPPRSQKPLPLSLPTSLHAPSPLTVLPPYLLLCVPFHPIEIVEGPCLGEGVMITASQSHTICTIKIG